MELNRVMKRKGEVAEVGPGTEEENPESDDYEGTTGEVGRFGRRKVAEGRHLPGVLDWNREEDLLIYLRERGAQDLIYRSDLHTANVYILQRMAARCALEEMNEQLEFSEDHSIRADEIISNQDKIIGRLEAKLYNMGVVVTEEGVDSEGERWVAGIEERKEQKAVELQRRRANTALEASREMSIWKTMKMEHNGIDPKVCLTPGADVLHRLRRDGQPPTQPTPRE
jgi:hypothetical protein